MSNITKELISAARKTGYIVGFTDAVRTVNRSMDKTRGEDDSVRLVTLLKDLQEAFTQEDDEKRIYGPEV